MIESITKLTKELLKNMLKPSTIDYPAGELKKEYSPLKHEIRGRHKFDEDKCVGCAACEAVCSSGAITIHHSELERKLIVELARCIFCGRCSDICPEKALEFEALSEPSKGGDQGEQFTKIEHIVELGRCENCGKPSFPIKQIEAVKTKVDENIEPSNKETITKDMEIYMRYCSDCRRIKSYSLKIHPRKSY